MTILIITVLVSLAIVVLIYPFWSSQRHGVPRQGPAEELARELQRARNRIYEELRVLEQEYFLDSLGHDEYESRVRAARLNAARLIREQERIEGEIASIEQRIHNELEEILALTETQAKEE